ncbi:Six-hairpin glycosidase-like protein [Cerioporus squamosus]|nr:Six-hairpin glycosidase-like protein [Cerioporus squamosus]
MGTVSDAHGLVSKGSATIVGNGSWVALDFGVEVGGLVTLKLDKSTNSSSIALSFTESPAFISPVTSDDSTYPSANQSYDGVEHVPAPLQTGFWTQPAARLRGGFRYLTIVSTSDDPVTVSNVSCAISFAPHISDLRDYSGYFYASDPAFHDKNFLTKLWYAGAYTVQTNTVPLNTGRQIPMVSSPGWANNATLGVAGPIIVDGAKRDRQEAVWPGDMGIAVPTQFVSTNDLIPTRNALSTMFAAINPVLLDSDTYHAWTLIGTHNYYLYSGDSDWLQTVWTNYTKAVGFLEGKVGPSGLMNVTGLRDWARLGGGGINAEGNALLYRVLVTAADLATHVNDSTLASAWTTNATALKTKFNEVFWLPSAGMYRDNDTTTLCPQDANSMAVLYNLTTSPEQAASVSEGLTKNWNDLGSVAPELPDTISPFISGLELQAHFESGNDERAMDLLRREWGYMLYTNLSPKPSRQDGALMLVLLLQKMAGYEPETATGLRTEHCPARAIVVSAQAGLFILLSSVHSRDEPSARPETSSGPGLRYRSYRGYNYDPAYTSHAHGWSSGPTSALTYYVLGLTVTSPQGRTWQVAPHLSGLSAAEGGFTTPLGWFGVKWTAQQMRAFSLTVDVPEGTSGVVKLPVGGKVTIDGEVRAVGEGGGMTKACHASRMVEIDRYTLKHVTTSALSALSARPLPTHGVPDAALIVYEHLLTAMQEYRVVWKRKMSIPMVLFVVNRYGLLLFGIVYVLSTLVWWGDDLRAPSCEIVGRVQVVIVVVLDLVNVVFSALRIHAINNRNWWWTASIFLLGFVSTPLNIACSGPTLTYGTVSLGIRACKICLDVVVLGITWYRTAGIVKATRGAHVDTSVVSVLLRDGTTYFFLNAVTMSRFILNLRVATSHAGGTSRTLSTLPPQSTQSDIRFSSSSGSSILGNIGASVEVAGDSDCEVDLEDQ